jgi:hypothetical protein
LHNLQVISNHRHKKKAPAEADAFSRNWNYLTAAFSFEPAETFTVFDAGIWMVAPVCGLRPVRAAR